MFKLKSRKKERQTANLFGRLATHTASLKKTTCCNRSREKTKLSLREKHNYSKPQKKNTTLFPKQTPLGTLSKTKIISIVPLLPPTMPRATTTQS